MQCCAYFSSSVSFRNSYQRHSNAADLIGRAKDVGTLEAGKYADVIAVTGDPLQDVRALENMGFVMKGGVVVKDLITGRR